MGIATFGYITIALLSSISLLLLRFFNRNWWDIRGVRQVFWAIVLLGLIGWTLFGAGRYFSSSSLIALGAIFAPLMFVFLVSLAISLPFSGILNTIANYLRGRDRKLDGELAAGRSVTRRKFLHTSAAIFPVAALSAGAGGFVSSFSKVKVYELPLYYNNLPPQLDGFRIFHMSDLHLGRYFLLSDLVTLLQDVEPFRPDLVLVTGDISDVNTQLADTLSLTAQLRPPYGCISSVGNHEYYHGIRFAINTHAHSEIPLLINEGVVLNVNGAELFICGADDPARLFGDLDGFLRDTVDRSLYGAPSGAFKIVMSHRPRGFVEAANNGVELTLSGHTHGGQIGINGKSIFETTDPPNYYWGHYMLGASHLYTSSGVGHWFPFRLGCPAEAPVVVLRSTAQLS